MARFEYQPLDASRSEFRLLYPTQQTKPDASRTTSSPRPETMFTQDDFFVTPDLSMEFELRTVSLDSDFEPVYTALSYVWGDSATTKYITVNGCTFAITESLNIALRHLQYDSISPAIWIDAICINQGDCNEKNDQIPRMGRIYSGARDVLVWLGPGTSEDHHAVMVLYQYIASIVENWRRGLLSLPKVTAGDSMTESLVCDHDYTNIRSMKTWKDDPCKAVKALTIAIATVNAKTPASMKVISDTDHFASWWMSSFLASDWWNRIWVIQEYTLARSRQFQLGLCRFPPGTMEISRGLVQCIKNCLSRDNENSSPIPTVDDIPNHFIRYDKGDVSRGIFDILKETYVFNNRELCCRDAKDRIFALISLAERDCKSLGIRADYGKTTREVYIDVARRLLCAKKLDVLSLCQRRGSACLKNFADPSISNECYMDLPSWVPDWSVKILKPRDRFSELRDCSFVWPVYAQDSDPAIAQEKVNRCPDSIILTGRLLDEITRVGSICLQGGEFKLDKESRLNNDWPLTPFETLVNYSSEIEALFNSSRKIRKFTAFRARPYFQHAILCRLHDEIIQTLVCFVILLHLLRSRSFNLRHFREFRKFQNRHFSKSEIHPDRKMQEAIWRIPVWNEEYTLDGKLTRPTESSKAHYQTSLHIGLSESHARNAVRLDREIDKHGILQNVRYRILLSISKLRIRFHDAMAIMCCKSPTHKLAQLCCILASSFLAIMPLKLRPSRLWDEAYVFASYYVLAMLQGPPNRAFQTKTGYIGSTVSSTQPGDRVCRLSGSRVPHVLRKRSNGQAGYTLVGDAFVYDETFADHPEILYEGPTCFEIF